jgi:signal transduction histidine kinase
MNAEQLISLLIWTTFIGLFVTTTITAVRFPLPSNIHTALLFSAPAASIALGFIAMFGWIRAGPITNALNSALIIAIPYLLLQLVDDFVGVPNWLMLGAAVGLGLLILASFIFAPPRPIWYVPAALIYVVGLFLYGAVAFVWAAWRTIGVTRRRLQTVALGSLLLGLALLLAGGLEALPEWWRFIFEFLALASGISYFLGFAPPGPLRRTWQEPELLDFLKSSISLSHTPDDTTAISLLEKGAAAVFGAPTAQIGLWDPSENQIRFTTNGLSSMIAPGNQTTVGKAFLSDQPVLGATSTTPAGQSEQAEEVRAVLAAPLISGTEKIGVLAVYTPRSGLFASDDLVLVDLLAAQVAATITSRRMIADLAYTRGQKEAMLFKEDFLSAAAHDLKTPLTTLVAQTQLLERQLQRDPSAPINPKAIARLGREAQRLRSRILDLLDAAQAERGQLVGKRIRTDLSALILEEAQQISSERHPMIMGVEPGLIAAVDRNRITQLLHNLLENAVLYSPIGGDIEVSLVQNESNLLLAISDHGIGIPPPDLPRVFERFFRGSNVNDRHFAGMGLSLFICRAIAEQHGGTITVTSTLGQGSQFVVTLPAASGGDDYVDKPANPDS